MTDYPQWVRERACELANAIERRTGYWTQGDLGSSGAFTALADLILKYETAPVDPDLLLAREAVATVWSGSHYSLGEVNRVTDGYCDDFNSVSSALAAIKLARERNAL